MNKKQLIDKVSEKLNLPRTQVEVVLNEFIKSIIENLRKEKKVTISGFGTFSVTHRKEKMGINPKTGERIKIAATKTPKFTCGKPFKEAIR
jgi:DNA-binding protein HU-beta